MEEREEVVEAVRGGEGSGHPLEGGVVVAEGVEGGGVAEDMEVEVGEFGVVVEVGFEEGEEVVGGEGGRGEVGLEEVGELGLGGGGVRERVGGEGRGGRGGGRWREGGGGRRRREGQGRWV